MSGTSIIINGRTYTQEQLATIVSELEGWNQMLANPVERANIAAQLTGMQTPQSPSAIDPLGNLNIDGMTSEQIAIVEAARQGFQSMQSDLSALKSQLGALAPTVEQQKASQRVNEAIQAVATATGKQLTPEQLAKGMETFGTTDPETVAWRLAAQLPTPPPPPTSPTGAAKEVFIAYDDTPPYERAQAAKEGKQIQDMPGKTPQAEGAAVPPAPPADLAGTPPPPAAPPAPPAPPAG